MYMLYLNDATHEPSLVSVEAASPEEQARYRAGVTGYHQRGDMEKLLCDNPARDLNVYFDEKTVLIGRCGPGVIITDEQAQCLRDKSAAIRAERVARAASAPRPTAIQTGEACHSCGLPRRGRGECPHCGDDTRY